jgi:redox-sensitive bicupin YhaK (pirin superfamily)
VTIVYEGEVAHRDSTGAGGTIGRGDVQWMTAGSGIVHEEFHGENYRKTGGPFEMVQLWVNLPKKDKMTLPGYQGILSKEIPEVELKDQAGTVRVIAGEFGSSKGPARTFSPMNVWDVRLNSGKRSRFSVPDGYTTAFLVLEGEVQLTSGESIKTGEMGVLDRTGNEFELAAQSKSKLLFLIGKPLNEPVVGHGPFVMNTEAEIHQAFIDYESGKMGRLSS